MKQIDTNPLWHEGQFDALCVSKGIDKPDYSVWFTALDNTDSGFPHTVKGPPVAGHYCVYLDGLASVPIPWLCGTSSNIAKDVLNAVGGRVFEALLDGGLDFANIGWYVAMWLERQNGGTAIWDGRPNHHHVLALSPVMQRELIVSSMELGLRQELDGIYELIREGREQ